MLLCFFFFCLLFFFTIVLCVHHHHISSSSQIDDAQNEDVSRKICVPCITRINKATEFKERAIQSNRRLKSILLTRRKNQNLPSQPATLVGRSLRSNQRPPPTAEPVVSGTNNERIILAEGDIELVPTRPPRGATNNAEPTFELLHEEVIKQEPVEDEFFNETDEREIRPVESSRHQTRQATGKQKEQATVNGEVIQPQPTTAGESGFTT